MRLIALYSIMLTFSGLILATKTAGQEDVPHHLYEERLRELRTEFNDAHDQRAREWAIEQLCAVHWPRSLVPKVADVLRDALEIERASRISNALRNFSGRFPLEAARFVPDIARVLNSTNDRSQVELLNALRYIGPDAAKASESTRRLLNDKSTVVQIHAASTLASIVPNDREACDSLLQLLSHESPFVRWQTAYAVARSGADDTRFVPLLNSLLEEDDVRIRVSAADALFEVTGDSTRLIPILVDSISEPHRALAIDFVYPSHQGISHQMYALATLGRMGDEAKETAEAILGLVEEFTADDGMNGPTAYVGLIALSTLGRIGPHKPGFISKVNEICQRDGGFLERFPARTKVALEAIARHN